MTLAVRIFSAIILFAVVSSLMMATTGAADNRSKKPGW